MKKIQRHHSQTNNDVCENLKGYDPTTKIKVLIFDHRLTNMKANKILRPIVTELFRGIKLNIPLVPTSQSYLKVPKDIRPSATHYFIMKIPKKRDLKQD